MKLLRASITTAALALLCAGSAMAQQSAQQPAQDASARALHTRQLAANCAACHGTNGRAVAGSPVVGLAGMPAATLTTAMREFKDGKRQATVMHQIAKGLSDEQVKTLADYFAAQKP